MFNISQNTILLQVYLFERLSVWGGGGGGGGGGKMEEGEGGGYVNNQNTSCNVRLQCQK